MAIKLHFTCKLESVIDDLRKTGYKYGIEFPAALKQISAVVICPPSTEFRVRDPVQNDYIVIER